MTSHPTPVADCASENLVTDAMIDTALNARVPGGSEVWVWLPQKDAFTPHQTARDVMRCALQAVVAGMAQDAARFRALMRCGRIKMQGSSGVDPTTCERNGNNVHFGAEFWPEPLPEDYRAKFPDEAANYDRNTRWGRAAIAALADAILEQEAVTRKEIT